MTLVIPETPEGQGQQALTALTEGTVTPGILVTRDNLALLGDLDQLVKKENVETPGPMEILAAMAGTVLTATKGQPVILELLGQMDPTEETDCQAQMVARDPLVVEDLLVVEDRQDQVGQQVLLVVTDPLDHKDQKGQMDRQDQMGGPDLMGPRDLMDLREQMAQMDLLVVMGQTADLDQPDQLGLQATKVIL